MTTHTIFTEGFEVTMIECHNCGHGHYEPQEWVIRHLADEVTCWSCKQSFRVDPEFAGDLGRPGQS